MSAKAGFSSVFYRNEQVCKPGSVSDGYLSVTKGYPFVHATGLAMPSRLNCKVGVAPGGVYTGIQLPSSL